MTDIHQRPYIGVHLMLIQDGKLLLQRRKGFLGQELYIPVSGHVDIGETSIEALVR